MIRIPDGRDEGVNERVSSVLLRRNIYPDNGFKISPVPAALVCCSIGLLLGLVLRRPEQLCHILTVARHSEG